MEPTPKMQKENVGPESQHFLDINHRIKRINSEN